MKIIDLSLTIAATESEPAPVEIEYITHAQGAYILGKPHSLGPEDFPNGYAISTELVKLTSHSGTHIDAPLHYGPLCEGVPSRDIAALPLNWFFSNGVVLHLNPGLSNAVSVEEIKTALTEIDYSLQPLDIVLLHTGADKKWGTKEYFTHFRGVSIEATEWLTSQGIKIIGVDTFGFDPPFQVMLEEYKKTKDKNSLWPAHIFGRKKEYCQIERLTNLEAIPVNFGFKIACFPVKIQDAGAGWSRVVAILEDNL